MEKLENIPSLGVPAEFIHRSRSNTINYPWLYNAYARFCAFKPTFGENCPEYPKNSWL